MVLEKEGKLMYDELVKRLRASADNHHEKCDGCPYEEDYPCCVDCLDKMHKEAADAIEELSKPCWIPVTERLPEKTGTYLAWMKWDLTEADEEPSAYPVLYDADEKGFGWWKSYYDGETLGWAGEDFIRYEGITHWMPLPQPPEEE